MAFLGSPSPPGVSVPGAGVGPVGAVSTRALCAVAPASVFGPRWSRTEPFPGPGDVAAGAGAAHKPLCSQPGAAVWPSVKPPAQTELRRG